MLKKEAPEIPGVDVNALAAQRNDNGSDAFELLDELATQRVDYVKLVLSLSDEQMARLAPFFPKSHGKPRVDDRRVLSGIIFINRNGLR